MGKKDKRVDAYISKSAPFAKPILRHLRNLVHGACPDVEEKIKWGFPHFDYLGMMASMAAFKQHCSFGFWKAALLADPERRLTGLSQTAMGSIGKLTASSDLPPDRILLQYIREACRLNEEGIKVERRPRTTEKKPLIVPAALKKALSKDKKSWENFSAFSYSKRKDYIDWINEAKADDTRSKRIATTVQWVAEGKGRNWKYETMH